MAGGTNHNNKHTMRNIIERSVTEIMEADFFVIEGVMQLIEEGEF